MAKKRRPKFSHECGLDELADRIIEIVEEEGFDTAPRESLCYIADRIRELGAKHVPDVLRDLRDMGWVVVNHCDVLDSTHSIHEPPRVHWMLHKRTDKSPFRCAGIVFEGSGETDEDALWAVAARIARYELGTTQRLKYANELLHDGKSFRQAVTAAKKRYPRRTK